MSDSDPSRPSARTAALRYLSHRPRSESEVRTRLRRDFPGPLVEEIIAEFKEQALLDDVKFAKMWSDGRDSTKPRSTWAIKQELRAKGINDNLAEQAVQGIDNEDAAYRAAEPLAHRIHGNDIANFRHRLQGLLKHRGFSPSVSLRVAARLWDDISIRR